MASAKARARLRLPQRKNVVMTGETDPVYRHYQPLVGALLNKRLEMALTLMGERRFRRLLDAGYGGGIFFPELAARSDELYGVDVHPCAEAVGRMALSEGVRVLLRQTSICATGFPDAYFDAVVSMSVLEFLDDLPSTLRELRRITTPEGTVILGFPGENFLTDLGYRLARTPDPRRVHRSGWADILAEAERHLRPVRLLQFPRFVPQSLALFFVGEFRRP